MGMAEAGFIIRKVGETEVDDAGMKQVEAEGWTAGNKYCDDTEIEVLIFIPATSTTAAV